MSAMIVLEPFLPLFSFFHSSDLQTVADSKMRATQQWIKVRWCESKSAFNQNFVCWDRLSICVPGRNITGGSCGCFGYNLGTNAAGFPLNMAKLATDKKETMTGTRSLQREAE